MKTSSTIVQKHSWFGKLYCCVWHLFPPLWRTPELFDGLNFESKVEDNMRRSWDVFPSSQHFGGRGACWSFGIETKKIDKQSIIHTYLHKPNNKLLVGSWSIFGARTNHWQTRMNKIHHDPNLGNPQPSFLYYSLCLAIGPTPKCHFVPWLPNASLEIPKIGTPVILESHNFVCISPIGMRSEKKL